MIVRAEDLSKVLGLIKNSARISLDTETTGLRPYHGNRLFSIIVCNGSDTYYFNFKDYEDATPFLSKDVIKELGEAIDNVELVYMHNAKFDLAMLYMEGYEPRPPVFCTMVMARVVHNDYMKYDLASCAERIGHKKDDAVEEYIKKHKLWDWIVIPGKKTRIKDKHFDLVPFEVMHTYGEKDASITYELGESQGTELRKNSLRFTDRKSCPLKVMDMEVKLSKVCFDMEKRGAKIDIDFCKAGAEHESLLCKNAETKFLNLTGIPFKDSYVTLAQAFRAQGLYIPKTPKGTPSFKDEYLETLDNPVAKTIQEYRDSAKRLNTYFRGFLHHVDKAGYIHANIRQSGTATGRFSYSDPNLQNLTKSDKGKYPIRQSFIPEEKHVLVAIDYDQMEFRLMLDYAEQLDLIKKIMAGYDPHTATAELVGIDRRPAKVLNFGLLYGMGIAKLALTLDVSEVEARKFRAKYFEGLPKVETFLYQAKKLAAGSKYSYDWLGRTFQFPDPRFAYKAANAIIQGGCSSIVKLAMIELYKYLAPYKSRMLIQIHDEILFQVHETELHIVKDLQAIMGSVYPYKHIPLTCSVEHSYKSWGELVEGNPA